MKIELPCLRQEQDYTCVPTCIRIVLHRLGVALSETEICAACKTTPLGNDLDEAAQGVTLLGFNAVKLKGVVFDDIIRFIQQRQPVIVFVNVKHLPYGGLGGTHAVVVNSLEEQDVSFIDPARGEEITVVMDTFLKAWRARGCRALVIEPRSNSPR